MTRGRDRHSPNGGIWGTSRRETSRTGDDRSPESTLRRETGGVGVPEGRVLGQCERDDVPNKNRPVGTSPAPDGDGSHPAPDSQAPPAPPSVHPSVLTPVPRETGRLPVGPPASGKGGGRLSTPGDGESHTWIVWTLVSCRRERTLLGLNEFIKAVTDDSRSVSRPRPCSFRDGCRSGTPGLL